MSIKKWARFLNFILLLCLLYTNLDKMLSLDLANVFPCLASFLWLLLILIGISCRCFPFISFLASVIFYFDFDFDWNTISEYLDVVVISQGMRLFSEILKVCQQSPLNLPSIDKIHIDVSIHE